MPLRLLVDNRQSSSVANSFRRKRFAQFLEFISTLPRPVRILDVGGEENFWKQMGVKTEDQLEVTLLNLHAPAVGLSFLKSVGGDARSMPEFEDKSFDVVFSNSVIEHVGDFPDQARMAKEIRRIGKHYFVQTPAKCFPLEPHFVFPFFAVLPLYVRMFLVQHFSLGWYEKVPDCVQAREFLRGFQLLNFRQLKNLFPDAEIKTERFLGVTKSYLCLSPGFRA